MSVGFGLVVLPASMAAAPLAVVVRRCFRVLFLGTRFAREGSCISAGAIWWVVGQRHASITNALPGAGAGPGGDG